MAQKPKNIIFLMTDQQRLDSVSYHPGGKLQTPNIDRIAEGVGFTNCITVNPVCTPARTALLTGKYTHQIGTFQMSGDLSPQHPTYLKALQEAGYHTSGIGKLHWLQTWAWGTQRGKGLNLVGLKEELKKFGFDFLWEAAGKQLAQRNFCDYCEHLEKKGLLEAYRDFIQKDEKNTNYVEEQNFSGNPFPFTDEDYVDIMIGDKIVERIEDRPKDRPFFIFGSFLSPHPPYDPPQSYLDRVPYEEVDDFALEEGLQLFDSTKKQLYRLRQAYKAMVLLIDDQVGRIFEKLEEEGILEDTVILFTSDHGEMMGDHGRAQKMAPYWQSVNVPTAIYHPNHLLNQLNTSPVEITDLTATMLDIAGLNPQDSLRKPWPAFHDRVPCKSLLPIINGSQKKIREYAFSECGAFKLWHMIQTEDYKYLRYLGYKEDELSKEEFFDLNKDPNELINRIDDPELQEKIKWFRQKRDYVIDSTPSAQLSWAPLIKE
jgi:arylsulfatase